MGDTVFTKRAPSPAAVDHALAGVEESVFWSADLSAVAEFPSLQGDLSADLVVVGGGYAGLWTAIRAVERTPGRRVVLVEAQRLGWAASSRNGGFCSASVTHGEDNGRSRWPDEYAALERLGLENLHGIVDTVHRHGLDVDLEEVGELSVAVEPHQVEWLAEAAQASGGTLLGDADVRALVNSPTYLAGLESDDTVLVHPAKLVAELGRLAVELGVEIFENTPVLGLGAERRGGPVSVSTPAGVLTAARVALCTNVFPALLRRFRAHTVPVYDYVVMTEPLAARQLDEIGWQGRQGMADLANQFHYYRLSSDNRILFGGYDAIYAGKRVEARHEHRPQTHRLLVSHLLTTFPQLEGIKVTHQWAGAIDTSTRFCAFYGTGYRGRVAHAAGFTGLGVGASRFAADVLLDLLDGEVTERTSLEMVRRTPLPFPPGPIASGGINLTRWALDRADRNLGRRNLWLRTLDRLGLGFDS